MSDRPVNPQEFLATIPETDVSVEGLVVRKTRDELHVATESGLVAIPLSEIIEIAPLFHFVSVRSRVAGHLIESSTLAKDSAAIQDRQASSQPTKSWTVTFDTNGRSKTKQDD